MAAGGSQARCLISPIPTFLPGRVGQVVYLVGCWILNQTRGTSLGAGPSRLLAKGCCHLSSLTSQTPGEKLVPE